MLAGALTLAALALLADGIAVAEAAERDGAVLEALGGAAARALAAALAALLVGTAAAAALGVAAGVVLSRWLLEILGADAAGEAIVPPPRLETATAAAGVWWLLAAVLVATFVVVAGVAALRYRGLALQRALTLEEA
jgi:hypothetical protein